MEAPVLDPVKEPEPEPELQPAPSGIDSTTTRTAVGADDQCSWVSPLDGVRCPEPATDTVFGHLYCSRHDDLAAGI